MRWPLMRFFAMRVFVYSPFAVRDIAAFGHEFQRRDWRFVDNS